ncbi:MAG: hypothetical protein AAB014_01810 [Nitrospirota bacterium]
MSEVKEIKESTTPGYKIEYDPKLTEEIVSQGLKNLESEGNMRIPDQFRAECDPIYDQYPIADRDDIDFEDAFRGIYRRFFKILGYEDILRSALLEYPVIDEKVGEIVVKVCYAVEKEEANLVKRKIEDPERGALSVVTLQITSPRFFEKEGLKIFLRHELMHVTDMLDPGFCYDDNPLGVTPSEECIVKNHYSLIWDIYIDQRLVRSERLDPQVKDERRAEFDVTYRSIQEDDRISIFEGLWQVERLTHPQILACAKNPTGLLDYRAALSPEQIERQKQEKKKKIHLPGMICPLCKFPTHHWKEEESLLKEVIEKVKEDAPTWDPSDGLCERCDEIYRAIVGKW